MGYTDNALSIYYRGNEMSAYEYINALRFAIYYEVKTGRCSLIEQLVLERLDSAPFNNYGTFSIHLFPYYAIDHALKAVENGGIFPKLGPGIQVGNNYYTWDNFNNYDKNQFIYTMSREELQELGNRYIQLRANSGMPVFKKGSNNVFSASNNKKTGNNPDKSRKDADKIINDAKKREAEIIAGAKREAEDIIRRANDTAESIKEDARNRSASTQTNANTYAERIRRDADNETKKTRRDAEKEAKKIRQDAEDEAEQTRRKATEYLESVKRSAEDDAEGIRAAARQQMEEEAERTTAMLIQQKLSAHIQELRRQWEEEQQEKAAQRADTSALAAALKEEACTRSTTIGANLNQSLDQLQEQLNQLRSNMTLELQNWRVSLYKCEYGKLVNFYNTLNGYANSFERELREAECSDSASDELKTVLGEHSRKLNRLRSNLIGAMENMGMRLFTPQKGDLFNSYYHTTNGEEDDDVFLDREIERCLKPGIERVVNDCEVAVLLRASVEVQMR